MDLDSRKPVCPPFGAKSGGNSKRLMTTKIGGGAENVLYVFDMICKYMAGFGKYCMRLEHRAFYVKCLML